MSSSVQPGFDVAEDGTVAGRSGEVPHRIVVVNERGERISVIGDQARYQHVRTSADGSSILVSKTDPRLGTGDIESHSGLRCVA